jgi:DNA-binding CsgD family transcriptional regulator
MKGNTLSKRDANYLLELIYASISCTKEEELKTLIDNLKHLIPYEFALCGFGKIDRSTKEPYKLVNVSYPSDWIEAYVSRGLERSGPIVTENFLNFGLQYWADSFRKHGDSKPFISSAEDFGLKNGYSYGLRTYSGNKTSLFSFAGRSMERHARTARILEYITPHLHQALARISDTGKGEQNEAIQLSSREKEVLKWAKDGKSTWEISVILSISADTVKFHIKNIMQKLQAVSRVQAVAVAIEKGLIGIE